MAARTSATTLARMWPALPAIVVAVLLLAWMAFDEGGYFPASFTAAGAVAFLTLAVLSLRPPAERLPTPALVAIGGLAALAFWTGLSRAWSPVPDTPQLDMQRTMLYLGLFGLGLLGAGSGRHARLLIWGLLGLIVVIVGAGLLSRLQPDVLRAPLDPSLAAAYRLDHPLHYWNTYGALASLGAVLAAGLAADPRAGLALRGAAAAAAFLLAVAMYLSLSRGAWLAMILGLVVLVAIAPRRGALASTLAIVGAATLVAILRLRGYPALVTDPEAGSGQAVQGNAFTRELLAIALLVVAAQVAVARVGAIALLEHNVQRIRRVALVAGAVLLVLVGVVGYAARGGEAEGGVTAAYERATAWLDRQWQDFLDPALSPGAGTARLVTARGARSDGYRVAIDGFGERPLIGGGAGSFEGRYARQRDIDVKIRDAHSLPLETLSELGAVGLALLLSFLGAVVVAARRTLAGKGPIRPAEGAAVSAAFAVWLSHAAVDWDWEMPALTGIAIALSATLFARGRRRRSRRTRASTSG